MDIKFLDIKDTNSNIDLLLSIGFNIGDNVNKWIEEIEKIALMEFRLKLEKMDFENIFFFLDNEKVSKAIKYYKEIYFSTSTSEDIDLYNNPFKRDKISLKWIVANKSLIKKSLNLI